MPTKLQRRMLTVGPLDNEAYRQLRKIAKANGYDTVEDFIGDMVNTIAGDEDLNIWVPVAMASEDVDYAVAEWGEDDYRVMLDQTLGDALQAGKRKQ